jgi:hypothetical protein
MPEYTLRNVDPQLWSRFASRANHDQWPIRALMVSLMEAYASGEYRPPRPAPRELPEFAWLRAHFRQAAQDAAFASLDAEAQWECVTKQVLQSPAAMSWRVLDAVPGHQRPEILRWLQLTSNVPTASGLTLRAIAHIGEGPDLRKNRRAFQYEVLGLPPGQQAWIADYEGGWRVLRVIDGKQGKWSDPFETKEETLNTLAEVNSEPASA